MNTDSAKYPTVAPAKNFFLQGRDFYFIVTKWDSQPPADAEPA